MLSGSVLLAHYSAPAAPADGRASGILSNVTNAMLLNLARRIPGSRAIPLGFALVSLVAMLACGGSPATPTPDVQAIIDEAMARVIATELAPTPTGTSGGGPADEPASGESVSTPSPAVPPTSPGGTDSTAGTSPNTAMPTTPPQTLAPPATPQTEQATVTPEPTPATPAEDLLTLQELRNGPYLEQSEPQAAAAIRLLAWVADGIGPSEAAGAEELVNLGAFYPDILERVVRFNWIADGVTESEREVVENLHAIAQQDAPAASQIGGMPFLRDLEPPDEVAMRSLRQLAFDNREVLRWVLSHGTLQDGITDDWAKIIAVIGGTARVNSALITALLDPNLVVIEERIVELPRSGPVYLAIISTGPGALRSMDLLEHSVRQVEEFMAQPLPINFVAVLFEHAVFGASAGTNFGTHIAIRPKFDVDDGSQEADAAGHVIAHEVAHYYWSGNADWIDEGASDFLASISELARLGKPVGATNQPCAAARDIQSLESLGPAQGSDAFQCNYALGERIFVDMYRNLGEAEFRQGFRDLYAASAVEDGDESEPGTPVGIGHLSAAFRTAGDSGAVDRVVGRWYNGSVGYDTARRDTRPVDSRLPTINGSIDAAFVSTSSQGAPVTEFSASSVNDVVWLNLEYSYQLSSGRRAVPLEIVEYYEDGFETSRRSWTLSAGSDYIGGTQSHSVGPSPPQRWAPGRYWVYVYEGDRKLAEVAFQVTP